eukprot:45487-Hanusia_phi.AAC.1
MAPALGRAQSLISPYQQKPCAVMLQARKMMAPALGTMPAHPNVLLRLCDIAISTIEKIEIEKEERISRLEAEKKEQISRLEKSHAALVAHLHSTLADERERKLLADA